MRRWLLLWLLLPFHLLAQSLPEGTRFSEYVRFSTHLTELGNHAESIHLLTYEATTAVQTDEQRDSVSYLLGWNHYQQNDLEEAATYFEQVPTGTELHLRCAMFAGLCHAYLGADSLAGEAWENIDSDQSELNALINYEQAGLALLRNDLRSFYLRAGEFDGRYSAFAKKEKNLLGYAQQMEQIKRKSPFVAGSLSAILPGAGKVYAGKPLEGFAAFVTTSILAGAAYEQYRHGGLENPQFYVFGALFSVFYVGNIYGSVFSVKIQRNEQLHAIGQQVLVDLHVPLRLLFR